MTDANIQAIVGTPTPVYNPLATLGAYQDYANKVAQNAQIKASTANTQQETLNAQLTNQTGQQSLATTMAKRHAQIMYGLSILPDDQIAGAAQSALDDEVKSGQLDPQRAAVFGQQLQNTQGNPSAIRQLLNTSVIGSLAGPEAVQAIRGNPITIQNGAGIQGGMQGGTFGQQPGGLNVQGANVPTGMMSPADQTKFLSEIVHTKLANGQDFVGTRAQLGGIIGQAGAMSTPSDSSPMGNGRYQPTGQGTQGKGLLDNGPQVTPVNQAEQFQADSKAYTSDIAQTGDRIDNALNLSKALTALREINTGKGSQWWSENRSRMVTMMNGLGISDPEMNKADFNQAEADKLLTDYARKSGSATSSVAQLEASQHSNPSTVINNQAAQDFVRNNIGLERMKAAVALMQKQSDPNGVGYQNRAADILSSVDKRGFAYDTYSPSQLKSMLDKMNKNQRERFNTAAGMAAALKMNGPQAQEFAPNQPSAALAVPQAVAPVVPQAAPVIPNKLNSLPTYGD